MGQLSRTARTQIRKDTHFMSALMTQMHESVIDTVHLEVDAAIATMLQPTRFVDRVTAIFNSLVDKIVEHVLQSSEMQNTVAKMLHNAAKDVKKAC